MALKRQTCIHHPDRPAIGVCVLTRRPICGECSTRYEGVNYSREGLEILRRRRDEQARAAGGRQRWATTVAALCSPLLVYMLYLFYRMNCAFLIDIQRFALALLEE
jgi:hypothetical protein